MALFVGTHVNKVDTKGRVSVPASFRAALAKLNEGNEFNGFVLRPSSKHAALEAMTMKQLDDLAERLDAETDMFSDEYDTLRSALFANSHPVGYDGEGRVILPQELLDYAGVTKEIAFVGMGRTFEIWAPSAARSRNQTSLTDMRIRGLTLRPTPPAAKN
jgi:MraZ protein